MKYNDLIVKYNRMGIPTVDFKNQNALSLYNKAVMDHYYKVKDFILPKGAMPICLGVRLNYVEWVKSLIDQYNENNK